MPEYKGSAFRGVFGHAFKRVVCALRTQECVSCLVREACTYQRVFETGVAAQDGPRTGVKVAPHPYVLVPPLEERTRYAAGDRLSLDLLLMGPARGILPYLVYTFQEVGRLGLTAERKPLVLRSVEGFGEQGWEVVFNDAEGQLRRSAVPAPAPHPTPLDGIVSMDLVTPMRLQEKGRLLSELTFGSLFLAVWRRHQLLSRYYGGEGEVSGHELFEAAKRIETLGERVQWKDWTRWSNRQQTKMQLGGLFGRAQFRGDLSPFATWLAWAERFHVGKATSFGLGKVQLVSQGEAA